MLQVSVRAGTRTAAICPMPAATQITALPELPEFRRQWGPKGCDADVVEKLSSPPLPCPSFP